MDFQHRPIFPSSHMGEDNVFIIAGPCSAESEKQLFDVAREIVKIKEITAFRCGVWKPRTRPHGFEGVGTIALQWLQSVKREFDIPICVEVATPAHVDACLEHGIDMLWIGSRTTSNPFSVQDIAERLKGVDIPVLVKNPLNPDLDLWIGAFERLYAAGIRRLVAVHRGFSLTKNTLYRNTPCWEIPIEMRRLFPNLPQICDPSHMGGRRDLIGKISQYAMDIGMEGLMVEVHSDPDNAQTDAKQQITPWEFSEILRHLIVRNRDINALEEVEFLRDEIDAIDREILGMLSLRNTKSREIAQWKNRQNITIFQLSRWQQLLQDRMEQAEALGLNPEFVKEIMEFIHKESIRIQNET